MIEDFKPPDQILPYDAVRETLADMMERMLPAEDGGNSEAGKAVIRQVVAAARAQLEQVKSSRLGDRL